MADVGMRIRGTQGVVAAGALAGSLGMAYSTFGTPVIILTVLIMVLNRDWSSKEAPVST